MGCLENEYRHYFTTELFLGGQLFLPKPEKKLERGPTGETRGVNLGTWENHGSQKPPIRSFLSVCPSVFLFFCSRLSTMPPKTWKIKSNSAGQNHQIKLFQTANVNLSRKKADSRPLCCWPPPAAERDLSFPFVVVHVRNAVRCFDAVHTVRCAQHETGGVSSSAVTSLC